MNSIWYNLEMSVVLTAKWTGDQILGKKGSLLDDPDLFWMITHERDHSPALLLTAPRVAASPRTTFCSLNLWFVAFYLKGSEKAAMSA
ncbi:hypothetical protein I3J27_33120 [Bradyrhizobium xenonodulans]|uniref:Uncharacterized protein n=1 Tax=Bradyrhizobium xenonodulans TaxID=2736875 RepID=A0ABY7MLK5_9BRAD|nr:hypothetical protein [Bradyrhizobium xenonodulans]WBL77800.1 hypothetical protein I3J27_33120 [Bradyrhizobium xenonodulans]